MVTSRGTLAAAELQIRCGALLRGVRAAVERRDRLTAGLAEQKLSHLAITQKHAHVLLEQAESFARTGRAYGPGVALTREERDIVGRLSHEAHAAEMELPRRALERRGLDALDLDLLLLVAAPAVEPSFGGLYAYLNDAAAAVTATPRVAVDVLATGADHERRILEAVGPLGRLRCESLLAASGQSLRVADGVVELLWGSTVDVDALGPRSAALGAGALPAAVDAEIVSALSEAFGEGALDVVGVWGRAGSGTEAVAAALLAGRRSLRAGADDAGLVLQRACVSDAVCVIDVPSDEAAQAALGEAVAASSATVLLLGEEPLRSPALWRRRRFGELMVPAPGFADRRANWTAAVAELTPEHADDLAARFRLLPDEVEAVAALDRTARSFTRNGQRPRLDRLAGLVSRRRSPQVADVRPPARHADMLVLPPIEKAQVLDVAAAARAWPRVAERWQLERFGNPGVTALFTGDPGTGKTLAAEVIAAEVALDLMVVDLSRLVSKWIGETEKNLDTVFSEAEASSCVLFFDEADSVFGQRAEVTRGADRYANLEVGYLLQRLERYEGLVILASNLRGNLDTAFTRRFHHVVHFPRPAVAERKTLWELALAEPIALEAPIDVDVLAGFDLTGAGIAATVRGAALSGYAEGRDTISARDIVRALAQQFQHEARLLPPDQLGPYAELLG